KKGSSLNRRALLSQKFPCAPPPPRGPASTCIPAPLLPLRLCILSRTPYPQEEQPHRPRYTDNIRSKKRLEPQSPSPAIPKISLRSSAPPRPCVDLHSCASAPSPPLHSLSHPLPPRGTATQATIYGQYQIKKKARASIAEPCYPKNFPALLRSPATLRRPAFLRLCFLSRTAYPHAHQPHTQR